MVFSSPVTCDIFSVDRSLKLWVLFESALLTCEFPSFNNLSLSSSSSFWTEELYLQLSLYNDEEFEFPVPNSAEVGVAEFKLKKFIPFIIFEEPTVLEKVEADKAA